MSPSNRGWLGGLLVGFAGALFIVTAAVAALLIREGG